MNVESAKTLVEPYLNEGGTIDYTHLWSVLAGINGIDKKKKQKEHYTMIMEAYEIYKGYSESNLSQNMQDNIVVNGSVDTETSVCVPPSSKVPWITYEKGIKGPNDWIIKAWGHKITFAELAQLVVELYKNEDRIYPPPKYKGGAMLLEFLHECIIEGDVKWKTLRKYKLVPDF